MAENKADFKEKCQWTMERNEESERRKQTKQPRRKARAENC